MIIAVPKETVPGERRVALTPDVVKRLVGESVMVRVEQGAGVEAGYTDEAYRAAGAEVTGEAEGLWKSAHLILKVQRPLNRDAGGRDEIGWLGEGSVLVGMLQPLTDHALVRDLARVGVTSFSLDALPRISRAQSMDVLSAMSTVAGYKAALLAAAHLNKFFPMLVTAAGTVAPARVLVLGAGVAGLQAIATARRLGAVVQAFDVRPEVKEQIESLGAKFLEAGELAAVGEGEGGYAKELSEEQHRREQELIHEAVKNVDAVITTALVPGKRAPMLITEAMVRDMRPGSVIVDLASEMGGNCELTRGGENVTHHGVLIMGPVNLPSSMPFHASQMYARNLSSFLALVIKEGEIALNFEDEIIGGTCITHEGRVVNETVRQLMEGGTS
ncbi:MAG: Re/Si-specific NAD(P)(+) transhydrogenase subunit alpha [Gemmatimonadales bacterium]